MSRNNRRTIESPVRGRFYGAPGTSELGVTMKQSAEFTRFSQARTKLVMQHVFFAHLALGLRLVEDPTFSNPAATDGRRLIFNPNMTASWSAAQIMTTVAHEAM